MCLMKVSKRKLKETGFGWKVFRILDGKLYGEFNTVTKIRPLDKWLKEKEYRSSPRDSNIYYLAGGYLAPYPTGWHIFKKKKDAQAWKDFWCRADTRIHKVEYRKARTRGQQETAYGLPVQIDCIVAKEIKILPLKGE